MLPRERRLRTGKEILHALRRGNRRTDGSVACSFVCKPGMLNRSAIIVDTKVAKRAVVRNLLKRRVRQILQESALPGGDLVIRLHKGSQDLKYPAFREHVLACLKRIG